MGLEHDGRPLGELFSKLSVRELSSWLLGGLDIHPETLRDERSDVALFCSEAKKTKNILTQKKISDSVIQAVGQWNPDEHPTASLQDLALITATMRYDRAVPGLAAVVDNRTLSDAIDPEENVRGIIVAVIAGFSDTSAGERILSRWYGEESLDWKYTPLVGIALMKAHPDRIAEYLPKLFRDTDAHADYFRFDFLTGAACEAVGADTFEQSLRESNDPMATPFLEQIPVIRQIFEE